jgi:hypothetical protein
LEKNTGYPTIENNLTLYNWVNRQRLYYRRKKISNDRINKLLDLEGWSWTINKNENKWMTKYQLLKQFIESNGRYPKSVYDEGSVGFWVVRQRQMYRESRLSDKRIALLSELSGWKWDGKDNSSTLVDEFVKILEHKETDTEKNKMSILHLIDDDNLPPAKRQKLNL